MSTHIVYNNIPNPSPQVIPVNISTETPDELFDRIKPQFDAVGVDNLTKETSDACGMAELSGNPFPDAGKRLMSLLHNGTITGDQYDDLVLVLANRGYR